MNLPLTANQPEEEPATHYEIYFYVRSEDIYDYCVVSIEKPEHEAINLARSIIAAEWDVPEEDLELETIL